MRVLLIREFRRILNSPLPWVLLVSMVLAALLCWFLPVTPQPGELLAVTDPLYGVAEAIPEDSQLKRTTDSLRDSGLPAGDRAALENAVFQALTASPGNLAEFEPLKALLNYAREENRKSLSASDHAGLDFSEYSLRLFRFSQAGVLVLSALLLGLQSAERSESPLERSATRTRLLQARVLAAVLIGAMVLIVPRLVVSIAMAVRSGPGGIDLLIPYNPKAGYPLYLNLPGEKTVILMAFSSVRASSLIRLGTAFFLMYLYELLQIFLWTSLGFLSGTLFRSKASRLGAPLLLLFSGKVLAPMSEGRLWGFFFPIYQDALRDVIGGGTMLSGFRVSEDPPLDYGMALAVMLIAGLSVLYLGELRFRRSRSGVREESNENL